MGGYGGSSNRVKDKCYYDTGGHKVKDKNSIEVAEYYIDKGKRVAFLQEKPPEKRADLSVEGVHVEVKGMISVKPNKFKNNIREAFEQIEADLSRYSKDKRKPGKVVILSKHENFEEAYKAARKGYAEAKRQGYVKGTVEFWHNGKIYILE